VDAGHGWLIFRLPPAEVAVHPGSGEQALDLYLTCDSIEREMAALAERGVTFTQPVSEQRWGRTTAFRLPGGATVGLYEPSHPTAFDLE